MTPDQCTDAVIAHLKARARPAVDSEGAAIAADLRRRVAVPVGRSGSRIIRSKPGEPPRKEHGDYQKSIRHTTTESGDTVRTEAGTTHERGPWFANGTSRMAPRPHFPAAHKQATNGVAQRIKDKL